MSAKLRLFRPFIHEPRNRVQLYSTMTSIGGKITKGSALSVLEKVRSLWYTRTDKLASEGWPMAVAQADRRKLYNCLPTCCRIGKTPNLSITEGPQQSLSISR